MLDHLLMVCFTTPILYSMAQRKKGKRPNRVSGSVFVIEITYAHVVGSFLL